MQALGGIRCGQREVCFCKWGDSDNGRAAGGRGQHMGRLTAHTVRGGPQRQCVDLVPALEYGAQGQPQGPPIPPSQGHEQTKHQRSPLKAAWALGAVQEPKVAQTPTWDPQLMGQQGDYSHQRNLRVPASHPRLQPQPCSSRFYGLKNQLPPPPSLALRIKCRTPYCAPQLARSSH